MKNDCASYCSRYLSFLAAAKTERRAYAESVRLLEKAGFVPLSEKKTLRAGDRVYRGYHGKTLAAAIVGSDAVSTGLRIVGGHTDAPRLDLKPKPLLDKGGLAFLDTHIYGGIKKFQWVTLPLALYGVVVRKDGTVVDVAVGDKPGDPVLMISDILPHFGRDQAEKKLTEAFPAEDLDVLAASKKEGKEKSAKKALVELLKAQYGIEESDLLSAELEIVPAGAPRELGLDRSMIAGYGHDDRVCAYAGFDALLSIAAEKKPPKRTAMVLLCDKEEVGSDGATGMQSSFFENTVAEMIARQDPKAADITVRRALEASQMLSADVCAAADPHFPGADSTGNEARLGAGPCAIKYTGGPTKAGASDARAEYIAFVRAALDKAGVTWQMAELGRAEKGGGGTIAKHMARFGMDVLDFGTPLLNMHAPWEIASKDDCWNTSRAYRAFFEA